METVVEIKRFFISTELGYHFPVMQIASLKSTHVSYEYSVVEYCTTRQEEHLLVAWETMKEEIYFSNYSLKLTKVGRWYLSVEVVLDREDVEEHSHAPQTNITLLAVGMGEFHLEKLCHFLWNNSWIIGCTWWTKLST